MTLHIHKDCLLNGPVQISHPISIEPINFICTQYKKILLNFYGVLLQEIRQVIKIQLHIALLYDETAKNGRKIQFIGSKR